MADRFVGITIGHCRRFLHQVAGINPVIPETGTRPAMIQTGLEFFVNQLAALHQFSAGFVGLAILIKCHGQNGINDGLAAWKF